MNSQLAVRQGAQRPNQLHLPSGKVVSSGPDVVEFAASAGLFLDDWQAWILEEALAERADGRWCAFEVCTIVPRQNGKGSILEALEIYHLFVLKSELVTHSAHEFKTAREHFLRMQTLIKNAPELWEQVRPGSGGYIHTGAGSESIGTAGGARLNFIARSRGSGRGFSGDLVVLDEAFNLPIGPIGAMGPTLSARPNPQVWYTSSAPHADSEVLHRVRERGLRRQGERLFFAEWSNPKTVDPDDPEAIPAVNPGWPHRLTPDNLDGEREMMRGLGDEYLRERLGVPTDLASAVGMFPAGTWTALMDQTSKPVSQFVALDVAPNVGWGSFAGAGYRDDGLLHTQLVERHQGTSWIVEAAKNYAESYGPIVVDPKGPVRAVLDELKAENVPLLELAESEFATGCAFFEQQVLEGTIRHLGQQPLDDAVNGAKIRPAGDAWRWTRRDSNVDISPLVAATLACWAARQTGGTPEFFSAADLYT